MTVKTANLAIFLSALLFSSLTYSAQMWTASTTCAAGSCGGIGFETNITLIIDDDPFVLVEDAFQGIDLDVASDPSVFQSLTIEIIAPVSETSTFYGVDSGTFIKSGSYANGFGTGQLLLSAPDLEFCHSNNCKDDAGNPWGWVAITPDGYSDFIGGDNFSWVFAGNVPDVAPVPIPAAAWLFGSALLGLGAIKRKRS